MRFGDLGSGAARQAGYPRVSSGELRLCEESHGVAGVAFMRIGELAQGAVRRGRCGTGYRARLGGQGSLGQVMRSKDGSVPLGDLRQARSRLERCSGRGLAGAATWTSVLLGRSGIVWQVVQGKLRSSSAWHIGAGLVSFSPVGRGIRRAGFGRFVAV
jgi:hypothetical protein